MRRAALTAALGLAVLAGAARADFDSDETTGYRVQNYRAPVTRPVEAGERIDIAALDRLRDEGAVLIDTMPQRGGYDPATGAWRIVDRRETIPGATWLPETGRGRLEPRLAAYFARHLARLTGGDRGRPIVFFCLADCWMSWNAVKRAAALGYTRLYWFADGTDGWTDTERPLVEAVPPPVPPLEDR
ncbi:MAG TPA: rhodanese-like domain-containing protein [Methylobacterium sp.]|jgi:PQQ-dependent catabolism-associated CXXCW motif protein|uniref:rhodanese-like domain-containing protein n=1 Tax=Methylorubrum sp. B1-46 TaxID=2897334 RepID=UPI001E28F087|nr:rhodanese-like domain-containing protein [Methylorubrum sp. B1-46]UGB27219.1 hypothetical protein LPC10_06460 [Methylorubrum sp. B1-46]HEV2541976.1 rhodanese-like domain-containing protein [Methylobacterium sp.]